MTATGFQPTTTYFVNEHKKLVSLAKWLSVRLQARWLWVRIPLQSLKNAYLDNCSYFGYDTRFIRIFSRSNGSVLDKNAIIFGVYNTFSMHADNRKKYILILAKGPTQGLNDTILITEAEYSINFSQQTKKFCLSLYRNGSNMFFVDKVKIYHFKAKSSELNLYPLCLGNFPKYFRAGNMKKIGLSGN